MLIDVMPRVGALDRRADEDRTFLRRGELDDRTDGEGGWRMKAER
jgi:hypothetical protein